jgi:hypothetical protein
MAGGARVCRLSNQMPSASSTTEGVFSMCECCEHKVRCEESVLDILLPEPHNTTVHFPASSSSDDDQQVSSYVRVATNYMLEATVGGIVVSKYLVCLPVSVPHCDLVRACVFCSIRRCRYRTVAALCVPAR